ncbi:MAG: thioredoxin family protein [Muribaculaceae bacterium]|nr:thioredoxin family protein [Muribaculaceae bacterium]
MKKVFLYAVMAVAAAGAASCAKTQQAADAAGDAVREGAEATARAGEESVAVIEDAVSELKGGVVNLADDQAFRPDTKVDKLTVLDFNATWCGPCKMLAPVFEAAADKFSGKVTFVSVDIDKCTSTATAFDVQAVPTVVILKPDGTSLRYVGTQDLLPAETFDKLVQDNL